jgi:hypothetical protein
VYQFPHGAGGVDFGLTSFASAAQARADLRRTITSDTGVRGLTVRRAPSLGRDAITLNDKDSAAAIVVTGSRELVVNISLDGAAPRMAVTLAADAMRRM